jgi:pyruvate formate lyase activating enzyme
LWQPCAERGIKLVNIARGGEKREAIMLCELLAGQGGAAIESSASQRSQQTQSDAQFAVEARFYEKLPSRRIKCTLCPRGCTVEDGKRGHCGVRENRGGTFYTLVHSRVCSANVDPIEKKPLFHYLPGSVAFSIATAGCNVNCKFCQNWEISQSRPEEIPADYAPPQLIATIAKQRCCPTIAYTYSEPIVFSEFLMDTADAAHEAGIRSIVVSNGYIEQDALRQAYGKMDAVKIDLKSFSDSYYKKVVGAQLKPVLETLVTLRAMVKWLEIVYMVVPTLNDSDKELFGLAKWIKTNLGADVPLHFTQFHPAYKLTNLPVTPVSTLERAKAIADGEGLHYVYIGNVPGHPAQNTYCPECRKLLVERVGFTANKLLIGADGVCPECRHPIPGIWHV